MGRARSCSLRHGIIPIQIPRSRGACVNARLAPGEAMRIERASLSVRFNRVSGDSRCPADALCIQGGSAAVRITVRSDRSTRDYELHTGDMRPVQHDDMTIALVQLSPYPFSSRTIQPEEYRATLIVIAPSATSAISVPFQRESRRSSRICLTSRSDRRTCGTNVSRPSGPALRTRILQGRCRQFPKPSLGLPSA